MPKAPSKEPAAKEAHRAHPLVVKDGKLVKPPRMPQSIEELAAWYRQGRPDRHLLDRPRRHLPRRRYD